jgi:hypothetical protein
MGRRLDLERATGIVDRACLVNDKPVEGRNETQMPSHFPSKAT